MTYPEIIISRFPHLRPISNHVGNQSRTKVSSQIDRISGLPAKAGTDAENDKEECKRKQGTSPEIVIVLEGEDHEHKDGAGDELGEELACPRHEGGRVCAEDACRGSVREARHRSDVGAAFVDVDGRSVVPVDDGSRAHGAEDLGGRVNGPLAPGKLAQNAAG